LRSRAVRKHEETTAREPRLRAGVRAGTDQTAISPLTTSRSPSWRRTRATSARSRRGRRIPCATGWRTVAPFTVWARQRRSRVHWWYCGGHETPSSAAACRGQQWIAGHGPTLY
jgi:hypothetical protein